MIQEGNRGVLSINLRPILERLVIEPKSLLLIVTKFESQFKSLVDCAN